MTSLFKDRGRAESFGEDPELYDRVRPSYPTELVDYLMTGNPSEVLDVGCGTGIVSRLFVARGCRVTGVEVDERMAEFARTQGLAVEVSRFETWDNRGRSFDLLVSGQAWHWVEPLPGARAAASCLRSGARFAVFWNRQSYPDDVSAVLSETYERLAPHLIEGSPLLGSLARRPSVPFEEDPVVIALEETGAFQSPESRTFPWERIYSVGEWLGHVRTSSDHRQLDPAILDDLLVQLEQGLTALGETFVISYRTLVITALRV